MNHFIFWTYLLHKINEIYRIFLDKYRMLWGFTSIEDGVYYWIYFTENQPTRLSPKQNTKGWSDKTKSRMVRGQSEVFCTLFSLFHGRLLANFLFSVNKGMWWTHALFLSSWSWHNSVRKRQFAFCWTLILTASRSFNKMGIGSWIVCFVHMLGNKLVRKHCTLSLTIQMTVRCYSFCSFCKDTLTTCLPPLKGLNHWVQVPTPPYYLFYLKYCFKL